ncbi:ABC transporter ATP-binding protein/permease [Verrucomicrobiales bacterium]|nr:ABC transporter ATP-binding protein/permease [Verrucomicrobiales bacterium]
MKRTFTQLWRLLARAERRVFLFVLLMMVFGMGFELVGIGVVLPAFAILSDKGVGDINSPSFKWISDALPGEDKRIAISCVIILLFLLKNMFLVFQVWIQQRFIFRVQERLSFRLLREYLNQPYPFHLNRNSAQLIQNTTKEMSQLVFNVVSPSMVLLTELIVIIGIVTFLMIIYPAGTFAAASVIGLTCCLYYVFIHRRLARLGKEHLVSEGMRIQHIQQSLGGVKELKLLGCEDVFLTEYQVYNQSVARAGRLLAVSVQFPRFFLEVVGVAAFAGILGLTIYEGKPFSAVVPILAAMAVAAIRLIPSANRIVTSCTLLRFGSHGVDTINSELFGKRSAKAPVGGGGAENGLMKFSDRIEFNNVSFSYENVTSPALSNASFAIAKNTSTGIVGPSGSGKSTLVDLLLGLLDPQAGKILVDQKEIGGGIRSWQDQIGYVPQHIYLFDDSLRKNIAFGIPESEIDDDRVIQVIEYADLTDFLRKLPGGLDSMVGERGVRLSGGQRQRIGIARALYRDPQVLVLDEATSALDGETESRVMETIGRIQDQRTVIIVAHRLSTVSQCDQLLRVEQGHVKTESKESTSA